MSRNQKNQKTLVEFDCNYGQTKCYIDPEAVESITVKRGGDDTPKKYITMITLHNGTYVIVDCTPAEAAERIGL